MMAAAPLLVLLAVADPGAARALFDRAEVKFNLGNFEAAAADYQAAYELDHRPALLFDVGQCYRNLGNYERARFFYRRYLTLDPRSPNRRETERLIDLMSERLQQQGARTDLAARDPAAASGAPASFAPGLQAADSRPADAGGRPVYRRTWFWVGVAGVVAGGVAAGLLLSRDDPRGSLPSIDVRSGGITGP
jgi:tetratricopeptide (TPR) repeat protein